MEIAVKNRDDVERGLFLASEYVLISISCPNDAAILPDDKYRKDVLRLEFDDLDASVPLLRGQQCKLFTAEQAKKIVDFFNHHNKNCDFLVVHCDAGISRSPAVAAALTKIQGRQDHDFFRKYLPNRRVYSLLLAHHYIEDAPCG